MARRNVLVLVCVSVFTVTPVLGDFDSGSDGSDGMFYPVVDTVVDLAQAGSGTGTGMYDVDHWAVVFNYTTITIPAGVTVTFANHPSGAPVVWLTQGNVTINGTVQLDGQDAVATPVFAEAGPGGFRGGREDNVTTMHSAGFGPGGGRNDNSDNCSRSGTGSGYATPGDDYDPGGTTCDVAGGATYGNPSIMPLIGGSGGAGDGSGSGGAGGGAILIASSGTISVSGAIQARGGRCYSGGSGSGGAIRLVANTVQGTGELLATGNTNGHDGGEGRIRLEAAPLPISFAGTVDPPPDEATPTFVFPPGTAPTLRVVRIDSYFMPEDPDASILSTDMAVYTMPPVPAEVLIEATHVPPGTFVTVRVAPEQGKVFDVVSDLPLQGSIGLSTTTAWVPFPAYIRTEIQLKASWTPAP